MASAATIPQGTGHRVLDATHHDDADRTITVFLTSFAGLGLPRTLALPVSASTPIDHVLQNIYDRLPLRTHQLLITTTSNKLLSSSANLEPIGTLLSSQNDTFLSLRLSARLCGGKGGFGSQLRAQGGRMSSRKKRDQNKNTNGSNRNLDGHRLRDVEKAKVLGKYLAVQDEEQKKAAESKKTGRESYLDSVEKQIEQVRSGKLGGDKGRLNAEYVESKEQAEERTRLAVMKMSKQSSEEMERAASSSSKEVSAGESSEDVDQASSNSSDDDADQNETEEAGPSFFGWDEDEDDEDDDEEDGNDNDQGVIAVASTPDVVHSGKGKRRAK